jgi:hypothetical protein
LSSDLENLEKRKNNYNKNIENKLFQLNEIDLEIEQLNSLIVKISV